MQFLNTAVALFFGLAVVGVPGEYLRSVEFAPGRFNGNEKFVSVRFSLAAEALISSLLR